jgi:copper transport protein
VLTAVLVLRIFTIASAHATLVSSDPANGSRIPRMPARVRLVFSEPIEPGLAKVSLVTATGRSTSLSAAGDPHDVHAIVADVGNVGTEPSIASGAFRVVWRVVSADGHPVGGSVVFFVGAAADTSSMRSSPPAEPETLETPVWGPSIAGAPLVPALLRGLGVGSVLALAGLLFFAATQANAGRPARVALWLSVAAPMLLLAHFVVWLINAAPEHRLDAAWLSASLGSTVGRVEAWRTGLSLLPLWALGLARRPTVALALTLPPILLSGAVGHSAAIHPLWAIPLKIIHLLALALWLGGLVWIVARDDPRGNRSSADIMRVSAVALWAVVAVTISGLLQTLILVPSIGGLQSPYGAVVVAKVAGLCILVAFGAYHRRRVLPRARAADLSAVSLLQSSVARELVVFSAVILLGGLLAYLSPPISAAGGHPHAMETTP